ncbi:Fic family protein [Scardovia wiggsiae]|uniref:Fic family protein n=1 Tax=Scardovia wiggsiae TaxID=230143 RepID=UPI003BAC3D25
MQIDALVEDIARFHDDAIKIKGYAGSAAERDKRQLQEKQHLKTVLDNVFHPLFGPPLENRFKDAFAQLAHCMVIIAKDHIFLDGNKRTAVKCMSIWYNYGVKLDIDDPPDPEKNLIYKWIEGIVKKERTETELADYLRQHQAPVDTNN